MFTDLLDEWKAITNWNTKPLSGRRWRCNEFSDTAIETALMLKGIFNLPLRALQGFTDSLFELMDVELRSPNYSRISKRVRTINAKYRPQSRGSPGHWCNRRESVLQRVMTRRAPTQWCSKSCKRMASLSNGNQIIAITKGRWQRPSCIDTSNCSVVKSHWERTTGRWMKSWRMWKR